MKKQLPFCKMGKNYILLFATLLFVSCSYSQVTTITYPSSGLSQSCNIFASGVGILASDGNTYQHTTMTGAPFFSNSLVRLSTSNTSTIYTATSYAITYPFEAGAAYLISANINNNSNGGGTDLVLAESGDIPDTYSGCGGSTNTPGPGNDALFNYYQAPLPGTGNTNVTSTVNMPLFIATGGSYLLVEAYPGGDFTHSASGSIDISSITITKYAISPNVTQLCFSQSQAYSVNTTAPVTWFINSRPISMATVDASGTVTTGSTFSGNASMTATFTDPGSGQTIQLSKVIHVGPYPSIIQGPFNTLGEIVLAPYTGDPYYFEAHENPSSTGTYTWTLTPPPGSADFPTLYSGSPVNITFNETGSYDLKVTKSNSCGTVTTDATITAVDNFGMSTPNKTIAAGSTNQYATVTQITVYPNPVTSSVHVIVPAKNISVATAIRVFDIYGKEIKKLVNVSQDNEISLAGLASGTYIVEVFDGKQTTTKKIIKN